MKSPPPAVRLDAAVAWYNAQAAMAAVAGNHAGIEASMAPVPQDGQPDLPMCTQ
ncbi:MAG: hypothetical protein AB7F35_18550 [Acetobacteraceae bacterium]